MQRLQCFLAVSKRVRTYPWGEEAFRPSTNQHRSAAQYQLRVLVRKGLTNISWHALCISRGVDTTTDTIASFYDSDVQAVALEHRGGAEARNTGTEHNHFGLFIHSGPGCLGKLINSRRLCRNSDGYVGRDRGCVLPQAGVTIRWFFRGTVTYRGGLVV